MERTKRNLLSVSASIFDPLGLIAPITARIKTIFQLLCKDKLNWDDIIPPDIALVWDKFLEELKGLQEIRQHRYVFDLDFPSKNRIELHGFSDSSKELYCEVFYLRLISNDGVKLSFLASKTKVAPLKTLTIPRLELLGCLLLSKLIKEVLEGIKGRIKLDNIICWSDSEVALCWIRGKERVGNLGLRIELFLLEMLWIVIGGGLLRERLILLMCPHEYLPTCMNVLRDVGFLVLLFSCHNILSLVGRTLVQMVLMEMQLMS